MNENINTLSSNLERIKSATDNIRNSVGMTAEDTIESVALEVEGFSSEIAELEDELEHAEENVLNTYFNINLNNTTDWHEMQKQPIPYQVSGLNQLERYFMYYPNSSIYIEGYFGQPTSLDSFMHGCMATNINMPDLDTSHVTNFANCFDSYNNNGRVGISMSLLNNVFKDWDTSAGERFDNMFNNIYNLDRLQGPLNVENLDVSNATWLMNMFGNSGYYITGLDNWDVSNVDDFSNLFSYTNGLMDIDLSNWYNNKTTESNLNLPCMFQGHYSGPMQRVSIPNIKDDNRSSNIYGLFNYDNSLTYADIRGLGNCQDYSGFDGVSPWCTIIVKDNTVKQNILDIYPDMKQIYTAAEFEENNNLYSVVNIHLQDGAGNEILGPMDNYTITDNNMAHFRIEYFDEDNQYWYSCWPGLDSLTYVHKNYPIILPRGKKYRIKTTFRQTASDYDEFETNKANINLDLEAGPAVHNVTLSLLNIGGTPYTDAAVGRYRVDWEEWHDITFVEGQCTISCFFNQYLEVNSIYSADDYYTFNNVAEYIYDDQTRELTAYPTQILIEGKYVWANGTEADRYTKMTLLQVLDENDNIINSYETGSAGSWFNLSWYGLKEMVDNNWRYRLIITYDGVEYFNSILEPAKNINVGTITLPTPITGTLRLSIKSWDTGELIQNVTTDKAIFEAASGSTVYSYNSYDNPMEFQLKIGVNAYRASASAAGYVTEYDYDNLITIEEGKITDHTLYIKEAAIVNITALDSSGNIFPPDQYWFDFYDAGIDVNENIIFSSGTGSWQPNADLTIPKNDPNAVNLTAGFHRGEYDSQTTVPYVLGQSTYNISVQEQPEPGWRTVTVNVYDSTTDELIRDASLIINVSGYCYYEGTNPISFEVWSSGDNIEINVSCDGYNSYSNSMWIDQDTDLDVYLEPELVGPYVDVTINVYDNKTNSLVTGDVNISLDNSDTGDHYNFTGNGRTWSVIAGHYTVDVTAPEYMNYRGYFTWLENRVASVRMDSTAAGMAHVTFEFDQPVDLISLYNGRTGLDYEYEQTTAQTFELEVPVGILLNMSASSSGFYSVDDSINVDGDKTLSYHFEPEEEPWFDPELL